MLCKSRRSSIALTLLFFFIVSIACCLPVGMAEDPPPAGGGGGGTPVGGPPPLTYDLTADPASLPVDYATEQVITLTGSAGIFSNGQQVDLWAVDSSGVIVGMAPVWTTTATTASSDTLNLTLPVLSQMPAPGLYAWAIGALPPATVHAAHFEFTSAATNELSINVSSPAQGAQISGSTLNVAGTVTGQPAWFRAEVWNYDQNEQPVEVPDIDITDVTEGAFDFSIDLAALKTATQTIDFTVPGQYELCLYSGIEGDSEGILVPVAYSITGQEPPAISELTANPNIGYLASTFGVSLDEPEGQDIWSETSNIMLQLVIPGTPPQTVTEVSFSNMEITENNLVFDMNIPANISEGNYAIEVWVNSEVKATAAFQVKDKISGSTRIAISPVQVDTGTALSFEFSLQGINLNYAPYAYVGIPPDQGIPAVVLNEVQLESLGDNNYRASFSSGLAEPGSYVLTILDGPSGGIIRWVAYGNFQAIQSQGEPTQPQQITLTPNQVNTGDSLSFTFDLSGVTLQNSPYAVIVEQPSDPGVQPPPVTGVATVTGLEAGGYQVAFSETIDVAGNYLLVIFDGLPTDPANLPPIAALGPFVVVANTNVLNLVLSPDYALIGTAPSFEFTVPSEFTMPEEPYGLILKPGESPVPVGNSALLDTETVGDEIYYTFYNGEAINEMGNYELHIFDGQPVEGSQPIAIGKFNVVPAFLPLSPPILTAGEQVSLAFDIPTNIPAADTRYAMLVEDTPEHQPVSGVTPVAITPASGSDSMWLATWPAELQLEPGNYLLAIFNVPPTMDTAPVAFGLFTVEPAFFRLVNEKLPPANVNQLYEATVEVANGTSPYTWELKAPVGATLPQDMALVAETDTSKAKLSFTPSEYGVLPIVIEVTDSSEEPQTVSQLYNLRILPPLFTLTPNKIVKGDPINFEFSLPPGVTVSNPYAVLGNLDTGFSSPAVRVSSSEGICQVSFYPWMIEDQPSGEYYVGIMEGMPQQDTRCLAAGKFDYVQLPWVNANPDPVLMPYPSGQNISLEEPSNIPLLWNENDVLTLQFFKQEWQQDIMKLTNVPFSGSIQILDHTINFTLPDEWSEGWYQVQVYRGEERIAISSFSVNYPWFDVTPGGIPAYFRQSPVIELWENQYEIWNAADTLEVQLVNNTGPDPESCERVLEATIPNNALFIADDVIRFNLPASIDCGYHDVELFRGDKLIARGSLNINAPQCGVQPRPLFIDAQNKTVSLHKDDPETWHASEAGQLKLDIHQKTYYGPEPWQYNLEYKQTIESANLTVNEDTISFVFPESLSKGRYELILQRKINADFWRTVGWGDLLYTDPPVKLQLTSAAFSGEPPAVKEGYELPINFTLTDTAGTAWTAGEALNLTLFHFDPIEKRWNIIPPFVQPYDVVVGEDTINGVLPPGIWAGDYTIAVSHANVVPSDEFALSQFRVLPLLELEAVNLPPAQVNQPYFGTVKVTGGTAPYYWYIDPLPPEYQWPIGLDFYPNENDSSQLIITGTFTEPGVYPLEIRVEDNDGRVSYQPIQLVVREGMPRVIAGNAAGLPGREVIVPIMGENLTGTGVSGIQFTLDYDPAVATIATDGVLPGMIPDATIESNIDNVNGHAIISIAWSQPLPEQVSFAEFCRIKFQINSNPANANCMVYLNDVDGTILSHGEYDIPAETINGSIRAASYGDVNGNGKVDVGDAVLILRHSAGIITLPEPLIELANVDDIDGVGPTDAILILKKVVRLINQFPIESLEP